MSTLKEGYVPSDKMRSFAKDLAQLLKDHGASICAIENFIPYCEPGHQVEFSVPGELLEMDTADICCSDMEDIANRQAK